MSSFYREDPPPFVDDDGNFVAAESICNDCGERVNVAFHPAFLGNMSEVQQWLEDNAPCKCKRDTWDVPTGPAADG